MSAAVGLVIAVIMSLATTWVSSRVFEANSELRLEQIDRRFVRLESRVTKASEEKEARISKVRAELGESIKELKAEIRDLRAELRDMPIRIRDLLRKG